MRKYKEVKKNSNYIAKIQLINIAMFIMLLSSCSQYDELVYFKNKEEVPEIKPLEDYVLRPTDILYIRMVSSDNHVNSLIVPGLREDRATIAPDASMYINSFIISNDSTIKVPVIGTIKAAGYTLTQFEQQLQKTINEFVIETNVYVRLLNFRITVLGEVYRPGVVNIYQAKATVLDAIALSGDLSINANRSNVVVLRNISGYMQQYTLDLADINIVRSPGYYVYPEDVIYVTPKRAKAFRENLSIYSLMLSTITTFILILNYIR